MANEQQNNRDKRELYLKKLVAYERELLAKLKTKNKNDKDARGN
jgi:hypothetical protein